MSAVSAAGDDKDASLVKSPNLLPFLKEHYSPKPGNAAAVKRYHAHSFFPVVKSYNHAMVSRANEPLELNATEFGPENGEDLISSDRVSTTVTKGTSGCKAQDNTFSIKAYVEEAKSADNVTFCLSFVMEGETKRDHKVKRNTFLTLKRRLATTGGKLVFDIGKLENRKEICA